MAVRIIAELGSCHNGKFAYGKEAIDFCLEHGIDAIKFQLFSNLPEYTKSGNVYLPLPIYLDLAQYALESGLECSASCFDELSFKFLLNTQPSFIKFAYSKKDQFEWILETTEAGIEAIVSCDVMTDHYVPDTATKLFCLPHYPVYFRPNFSGLFPRFKGFSDHTIGYEQTLEAIEAGAKVIEKHMTLDHPDIQCPDSFFALTPNQMANMAASIRSME